MALLNYVKIGFAGRVALFSGALILVSAASVGVWTYAQLNTIIVKKEFRALDEKAAVKALVLEGYFSEFSRDVLYRSHTAPVRGYVSAALEQTSSPVAHREMLRWRMRMQENFASMLTAKPYYLQIRLIGLDDQGQELVRVERRGNRIETIPDAELQSKGSWDYVKEGMMLRPDEVYLSGINLNREHGKISEPHTPVLRAVSPVYTPANKLFGIIVLNIDFSALMREVLASEPDKTTYLINQRGDFLSHPDPDKQFAFEYGRRFTSAQEFGVAVERLQSDRDFLRYTSSTAAGEEEFGLTFHRYRYDPRNPDRFLAIIDVMPIAAVLRDFVTARSRAMAVSLALIIAGMALALLLSRRLVRQIGGEPNEIEAITRRVAEGDLEIEFDQPAEASTGIFASVRRMVGDLKERTEETLQQTWLQSELVRLLSLAQTAPTVAELFRQIITELATLLGAGHGMCFIRSADENGVLEDKLLLLGSYAYSERKGLPHEFRLGEGLVGQCAVEKQPILLSNVPDDYVKIGSGLGEATPLTIIAQPIVYDDAVLGVIELASFVAFTDIQRELLSRLAGNFGVIIQKIWNQQRTVRLLQKSQELAEEAQTQAEELRIANEELEEQSEELQALNEEIREKSDELQASNEELEEKSELLKIQMQEVARKSADLEEVSRYKSEFLANMSHEIRTPLNSLLILSKSLEENQEGNLTNKQIEAARVIHSGGQELLTLINDILDLSKIEAGKLSPQWESIEIRKSLDYLRKQFDPVAQEKALTLEFRVEDKVPITIITDEQRLVQILRNLLSNAFKFTSEGRVELQVEGDHVSGEGNGTGDHATIAFTITDTGIGIAEELLTSVFEAFHQGDGSTSRRYGGTGLGLTISRELAELLGGQLSVQSRVGEGSRFTLRLPVSESAAESVVTAGSRAQSERCSDYNGGVPAVRSDSAPNDGAERLAKGAVGVLGKPVSPEGLSDILCPLEKRLGRSACELLVIGEGAFPQQTVGALQEIENVNTTTASSGREGLALLQARRFDCLVLDLQLSDIPGAELLKVIDATPSVTFPQTILCTEQELSGNELHALQRFSCTLVLKGENASQRLQEEVQLFIRKLENSLPPAPPLGVRNLSETDMTLKGKKVLIVDDDVRNTYALSHALDERGLDVVMADNGQLALEKLEHEDDVTLIVMDIMMPGMDGYEAMRRIRGMKRYEKAPIIALTAKAMPEDRSKCIAAGANDYLTKPVNIEELLSMMKTWLDNR